MDRRFEIWRPKTPAKLDVIWKWNFTTRFTTTTTTTLGRRDRWSGPCAPPSERFYPPQPSRAWCTHACGNFSSSYMKGELLGGKRVQRLQGL